MLTRLLPCVGSREGQEPAAIPQTLVDVCSDAEARTLGEQRRLLGSGRGLPGLGSSWHTAGAY